MAIIQCRECGSDISSEAKACPKCGCQRKKIMPMINAAVLIVFVAILCVSFALKMPSGVSEPTDTDNLRWQETFDVRFVKHVSVEEAFIPRYVYEITNKTDKTVTYVRMIVEVVTKTNERFTFKELVGDMFQGETVEETIFIDLIKSEAEDNGIDLDDPDIKEINIIDFEWE